jgi:sugar O-acyltransferase (sialic acid O-acetyltransferase NeuD family)
VANILLVGLNHELAALATSLGHRIVAVVDPHCPLDCWNGLNCLTSDEEAIAHGGFDAAAFAIDDPKARRRVQDHDEDRGIKAQNLIATDVGANTVYGAGLVVQRLANLSVDCRLGRGVRINVGANVMHDATIGDFATIAPNALLLGRATVGEGSYIGAHATILPDCNVGAGCMVGAGAVVTRDVPDGKTVKGVPAK